MTDDVQMIHYFIKLFKANCLGSVSVKTAIILSWGFKINLFDTYSHNAAKRFSCVPAEQNKTPPKEMCVRSVSTLHKCCRFYMLYPRVSTD